MDTNQRLMRLERQNRRLWAGMWTLSVVVGLLIFGAAYQPPEVPEVIQARKFEVLNDEGKVVWRADNSKWGGYAEALRPNGQTKCWWSGASPGDAGGMSMVWGGDDNEFRCVASTWDNGAFLGCIHGVDGKPNHQDGFAAQLDRRRGVRVSVHHDGTEAWNVGEDKGLRGLPVTPQEKP